VHPTAVVHATAKIGAQAHIGPHAVIDEDVEIGDNAVLLAHVVIYRGARIGDNFLRTRIPWCARTAASETTCSCRMAW